MDSNATVGKALTQDVLVHQDFGIANIKVGNRLVEVGGKFVLTITAPAAFCGRRAVDLYGRRAGQGLKGLGHPPYANTKMRPANTPLDNWD